MNQLSDRAEKYLRSLSQEKEWGCDKDTVIEYLEHQNVPLFKPLIRFQIRYSGFNLRSRVGLREDFYFRLFSMKNIKQGKIVDYWTDQNNVWFECGYHQTAQFNFYINQLGEILAQSGKVETIIFSSVEMMIEKYALLYSLSHWYYHPSHYKVKDIEKLKVFLLNKCFRLIRECCDSYNLFFTNGVITVECGIWWNNSKGFYFCTYGKDEKACKQFIDELKKNDCVDNSRRM